MHGTEDTIAAGFSKYTFNYPTGSGVFAWQITPRANFVFRTRVGALARPAQSPYALWDLYAALPRHKVHPYLQVTNTTNTSYQSIPGVPMPGRTIIGGVELVIRKHLRCDKASACQSMWGRLSTCGRLVIGLLTF